ncbi:MAG: GntR family transcriptional regulator [Dehalobacterium sp.]
MKEKIIKIPTLQEQVYLYLKKAIMNAELEVGKTYSEQWVADLLGVSRTPVREAIIQLKQEYLVDILPYKGFIVKSLSSKDIQETLQIRQALEGFCVISIAQNHQEPLVKNLISRLSDYLKEQEKLAKENNPYEFMEIDKLYHMEIIDYTNNERLIVVYGEIRSRFERITIQVLKEPGRMENTVKEHRSILEMMEIGNPWGAYQAMEFHLNQTKSSLKKKAISS